MFFHYFSIGPVLVTSDNFHSFRIFFQVDRGRKKSLSLKTPNLGNQIQAQFPRLQLVCLRVLEVFQYNL